MTLTLTAPAGQIYTIPEIIKNLGLEKLCEKPTANPFLFNVKDEYCTGVFDIQTGEVKYDNDESYNYYETELGAASLAIALDKTFFVWCKDENGNDVAYFE